MTSQKLISRVVGVYKKWSGPALSTPIRLLHQQAATSHQHAASPVWADWAGACLNKAKSWKEIEVYAAKESFTSFDGGEDAFFHSESPTSQSLCLGVADGVTAWKEISVDAGLISRRLTTNCSEFVSKMVTDPGTLMKMAYTKILDNKEVDAGSTTACLVTIHKKSPTQFVLESCNLGDSGFVVYRPKKHFDHPPGDTHAQHVVHDLVFESPAQVHTPPQCEGQTVWNPAPYQLAVLPDRLKATGRYADDKPEDAQRHTVELHPGDVVILGTDGLFENISPAEIPKVLKKEGDLASARDLAKALAYAAWDSYRKQDDITVVVARILH